MYQLYGISNCDTVKKAKAFLENKKLEFEFFDFKKGVVTSSLVNRWTQFNGDWPINPRGRTFRNLKDDFQSSSDKMKLDMILSNTSLIKRPVLERNNKTLCLGFDEELYNSLK